MQSLKKIDAWAQMKVPFDYKNHPGARGSYRHNGLFHEKLKMPQRLLVNIHIVYFLYSNSSCKI